MIIVVLCSSSPFTFSITVFVLNALWSHIHCFLGYYHAIGHCSIAVNNKHNTDINIFHVHLHLLYISSPNLIWQNSDFRFMYLYLIFCLLFTAIRFGRMPQSEKLKLKAEMVTGEREVEDPQIADQKTLARQIYEAYLKNFNMNKAKARTILTGKTSNPVRWVRLVGWWVKCVWAKTHFMTLWVSSQIKVMFSCNFVFLHHWSDF